jgi:hypothetical protein
MDELAQKLAKMNVNRARGAIRGMDKHTHIELFRVSVGTNQWITRFALPTKGLWITLVEQKEETGTPDNHGYMKTQFKFLEARVESLPDYDRRDIANQLP